MSEPSLPVHVVEHILEDDFKDKEGTSLRLRVVKRSTYGSADANSNVEFEISAPVEKDGKTEIHRVIKKISKSCAGNFRNAAITIHKIISARGIHLPSGSGPLHREFSADVAQDISFGAIELKGKFSTYYLEIVEGEEKFRFLLPEWDSVNPLDSFFYQIQ